MTERKTTLSPAQMKARIGVCERIASNGGTLDDASIELGTITPNGLYCFLRDKSPITLRMICKKTGPRGTNYTLDPKQAARRIALIETNGYTKAARMLGMRTPGGTSALYSWYKYRCLVEGRQSAARGRTK